MQIREFVEVAGDTMSLWLAEAGDTTRPTPTPQEKLVLNRIK